MSQIHWVTAQLGSPSFLEPMYSSVWVLLLGGGVAFLLGYILTFAVIAICKKFGWLDKPEERRIHKNAVPRLGGVGIFVAFVLVSLVLYLGDGELQAKEFTIYWLFLIAATVLVVVHVYDDLKGLKPLPKLIAQTVAFLILLAPWAGRFNGVLLFGVSNPFFGGADSPDLPWYLHSVLTLFINTPDITWLAIPAVIVTWFWMIGMMNTVNFIDGLDGLATGVVGITGLFITVISWSLDQHTIALLSAIFTGATLGFLPHNWNPAKIFMGDSGSQFLGLGLAVLSIMGGAKVALALMVLGIPILDVGIVMIDRLRRGKSPFRYDKNHLHHRFLNTGLSPRQICYILYSLTTLFGVLALQFPRVYKLLGIGIVVITMFALILSLSYFQRHRNKPMSPDEPPFTPILPSDSGQEDALPLEKERGDNLFNVQPPDALPGLHSGN